MPAAPPRLLLTGPAGSGKTHEALERVRESATESGLRGRSATRPGDVLLVLPTYAQAMHVARAALARWDARALLDDPFATFTSAGERYLEGYRVRALPSMLERDALMATALAETDPALFRRVAGRPSFRARLLRLVKEAKQSGRAPESVREEMHRGAADLPADARERLEAFLQVFERYESLLEDAGLEDHEDTLRRLAERLEAGRPKRLPRLLVVDGFDDFTPVELSILDLLADRVVDEGGGVLVTLPWDPERPTLLAASRHPREHLLARGFRERHLPGFRRAEAASLAALANGLFLSGPSPRPVPAGEAVEMLVAGDEEDEAEAVARAARRLRREGHLARGWRDLGVLVRRLESAGPRLLAAFERLGIPARLVRVGEPLASEAIVRALRGPLHVLSGDPLDVPALLPWLRWRATAGDDAGATARVDRLEMRLRREGWPLDLAAFRRAAEREDLDVAPLLDVVERLDARTGWAELHPALREAVETWLPLPSDGGLDPVGRPLDPARARRRRRAAGARSRVLALLDEMAEAARRVGFEADLAAPRLAALLLDAVDAARFALPDRRLDAVNILDFEEARFWELPVVVVAGLAQGETPLHAQEDLFLSDDDRRTLREGAGVSLPLARDLDERERRLFYGALTRATRRLVLARSAVTADGGPRAPSLYLREVERILDLAPVTTVRPAGRAAPRAAECFTVHDWVRFAARAASDPRGDVGERALAQALLAREGADLPRRAARFRRDEEDPVDLAVHGARIERALGVVSAGALGSGLACRYRLFLQRIAALPEDDAPLAGPGFDARGRGTLVHEALRHALLRPDLSPETVAEATLEAATGAGAREVGPLRAVDRTLLRHELGRIVRLLRRREARAASPLAPLPEGLEFAFGDEGDVLLGEGLRLRGRIDRIDADEHRAAIVDYKLSPASADRAFRAHADGLDVQLPLYALVVEQGMGKGVVGLTWMAATAAARYGVWAEDDVDASGAYLEEGRVEVLPDLAEVKRDALARATSLLAELRTGAHPRQREDPKRCGLCAYRTVCRPAQAFEDAAEDDA